MRGKVHPRHQPDAQMQLRQIYHIPCLVERDVMMDFNQGYLTEKKLGFRIVTTCNPLWFSDILPLGGGGLAVTPILTQGPRHGFAEHERTSLYEGEQFRIILHATQGHLQVRIALAYNSAARACSIVCLLRCVISTQDGSSGGAFVCRP